MGGVLLFKRLVLSDDFPSGSGESAATHMQKYPRHLRSIAQVAKLGNGLK